MRRAVAGMAVVVAVLAVGAGELQAQYAIGVSAVVMEQVSVGAADVRVSLQGGELHATAGPAVTGAHPTMPTRLLEQTFVSGGMPAVMRDLDSGAPVWRRHETGFTLDRPPANTTVESRSIQSIVPAAAGPPVLQVTRVIASNS
jgi:hypothetical protein